MVTVTHILKPMQTEQHQDMVTPRHLRPEMICPTPVVFYYPEDDTHILYTNTKSASSTHESSCRKAYISTASSVIHLEKLAQHKGIVVGVANFSRQPLLHVGQHVRQPLAAAHQQMH